MKLKSIGEDALVARLIEGLPVGDHVIAGAGDDCAVLPGRNAGEFQLFKTDCIVEGVHFLADAQPERIGWKAMARAVSDIGAMGGLPGEALITLVLPTEKTVEFVEGVYSGLRKCAEQFGVSIVGGETSRTADKKSDQGAVISVSLLGAVETDRCVLRSGGREGNSVFVTGKLGGSIKGWHLSFLPRVQEARWLVSNFEIHSMMDLSDGLASDLPRMAKASGVGFVLNDQSIPCSEGCSTQQALTDGEDYELLFTCSSAERAKLQQAWQQQFPNLTLTKIGELCPAETKQDSSKSGWDHFG